MELEQFYKSLGFTQGNPFQYTNADQEADSIRHYFVPPDYYVDLWGIPSRPITSIVYAPRGTGKTAQRIMIENKALANGNVLTVSYTNHDLAEYKTLNDVPHNYHTIYLNRLITLAFFTSILEKNKEEYENLLNFDERQFLYKMAKIYLYETPVSFPRQAIDSLKTFPDKALDIWKKFSDPISKIIQNISKSKGFEVDLSKVNVDAAINLSHRDNLKNLITLIQKLGFSSVYVLVDKIDETVLTGNNPRASFEFIKPLITDLELLEFNGLAFKFFLWDALKEDVIQLSRPDRVQIFDLHWSSEKLEELLSLRVKYFSGGTKTKIRDIFQSKEVYEKFISFSGNSPRDCIRILSLAITEQFRINSSETTLTNDSMNVALDKFTDSKTKEYITNQNSLAYLKKVGSVTFTIEGLTSKKIGSSQPAVRNIINPWTKSGLAKKIGIIETQKGSKKINEYAFLDSRIARFACPAIKLEDFYLNKIRKCHKCGFVLYRDFDKKTFNCTECGTEIS